MRSLATIPRSSVLRIGKRKAISLVVAVAIGVSFIPSRVCTITNLCPVREAQAQMGEGGPMNMVMMIVMMLLLGKMMNGQQGQPMLTGLQLYRAADGISNLNNAVNGNGLGVPVPGINYPNPFAQPGSLIPQQPGALIPQQPSVVLPLSPGNNSPLQPAVVIPLRPQ